MSALKMMRRRPSPDCCSKNGVESLHHIVKLSNARVSGIRQYAGVVEDPRALEDIAFTFQKIEIENKPSQTMATDSWMSANR